MGTAGRGEEADEVEEGGMSWLAILGIIGVSLVVTSVLFMLDKKRDRERAEYRRLYMEMLKGMQDKRYLMPCPYKRRTYEV